ncbi:hypothetical protein, partial [Escherichia coli]|uniref:hypothetical protein n=1 Tax=Escherichia coli TaxID=562 RepID=UPI00254ECD4D
GGTSDRNRSHWSTSKTPSYNKSVSLQHHRLFDDVKLLFNEVPVSILVNDIFFEGFFHEAT